VANPPVVMAPNAGLNGDKANGLALGANGALYMGGLLDGFIRRINNPRADPRVQTVDVVAQTTEQKGGVAGKGINGSMGMLGNDLYLPENQGFTVVKNANLCPTAAGVCSTTPLAIGGTFGLIFGAGVATDPINNLVYGSVSPGAATASIFQYDPVSNTSRAYISQGTMPAAGSTDLTVFCTLTCTRPADPALPPGGVVGFHFAQGLFVDPATGDLVITEDQFAGARGGRGHVWFAPFQAYPVLPPAPPPPPPPANVVCSAIPVSVPALASGQTYWITITAGATDTIKATWTIPTAQSAQLVLYSGNPFAGLNHLIAKGPTGKPVVVQNTSNTTSFSISAANQAAGTYTVQFFNGSNSFAATTGSVTFTLAPGGVCPASFPVQAP
jgi:hypothetical protein